MKVANWNSLRLDDCYSTCFYRSGWRENYLDSIRHICELMTIIITYLIIIVIIILLILYVKVFIKMGNTPFKHLSCR